MNPFIKKEIRLLLPSWLAVLSLAALLPWLAGNDPDASFAWMPFFIFFGVILLAVDSFGREFSLGTFSALMSQPMERRQIWRTKITILVLAAALIFIVFFINSGLLFHHALKIPIWAVNPKLLGADFRNSMFGSFAAVLIALAGGLWTTLLIRQVAAAFWITFLAPVGLLMLIIFFLPAKFPDHFLVPLLYSLAGIYVVAGCWFAHRLFHRAQDAAWTGGVISFSTWRYFEGGAKNSVSTRQHRPVSALLKKEFQLHSISLLCAGALLALHIIVVAMRAFYGETLNDPTHRNSLMAVLSEFFWTFWLVMPLVIGCMTVAEERKLGVMDGQFCQPVSRRLQFIIKFIPAMFFGVLLGGVMPLLLEFVAAKCGAPNDYLRPENHLYVSSFGSFGSGGEGIVRFKASIIALAAGLSFVGFFASTLAKNFLQALSIAIVISVACFFGNGLLFGDHHVYDNQFVFGSIRFGGVLLTFSIAVLCGLVFLPCLAYRNFSRFIEIGQVWRRNIFGLAGILLFVIISSRAIYDRAWEVFEPMEPAHGAPKLSQANPPALRLETFQNLLVRLPDGRVWFDYLTSRDDVYPSENVRSFKRWLSWFLSNPLPRSAGPQKFIQGSNWVDATARHVDEFFGDSDRGNIQAFGYAESVGIQSNGTLWVSEKSDPNIWTADKLAQLGDETNWQQLARAYSITSVLLLKKDGTLWYLGTNHFDLIKWPQAWPGLRAFKPYQIGTNSDWSEISGANGYYLVKKADGTVWWDLFNQKTQKDEVSHTIFDNGFPSQKTAFDPAFGLGVRIHNDGTLWIFSLLRTESQKYAGKPDNLPAWRIGTDTNWVFAVMAQRWMVALKSDGTLWEDSYDGYTGNLFDQLVRGPQSPLLPARLGIHDDWIAIARAENGVVSLAADGSLWFWPDRISNKYGYQPTLLRLPKQPKFLGNIFGGKN